jgi:hypothetical protein
MRKQRPDRDQEERELIERLASRGHSIVKGIEYISGKLRPYKKRFEVVEYTFHRKSVLPIGRRVFDIPDLSNLEEANDR